MRRTHNERIQDLESSIYGNGSIGIKDQLAEIRLTQKKFQKLYWMGLGAVSVLSPIITTIVIKLLK